MCIDCAESKFEIKEILQMKDQLQWNEGIGREEYMDLPSVFTLQVIWKPSVIR